MGALVILFAPLFAIAAPFQLIADILQLTFGSFHELIGLWTTYFA